MNDEGTGQPYGECEAILPNKCWACNLPCCTVGVDFESLEEFSKSLKQLSAEIQAAKEGLE